MRTERTFAKIVFDDRGWGDTDELITEVSGGWRQWAPETQELFLSKSAMTAISNRLLSVVHPEDFGRATWAPQGETLIEPIQRIVESWIESVLRETDLDLPPDQDQIDLATKELLELISSRRYRLVSTLMLDVQPPETAKLEVGEISIRGATDRELADLAAAYMDSSHFSMWNTSGFGRTVVEIIDRDIKLNAPPRDQAGELSHTKRIVAALQLLRPDLVGVRRLRFGPRPEWLPYPSGSGPVEVRAGHSIAGPALTASELKDALSLADLMRGAAPQLDFALRRYPEAVSRPQPRDVVFELTSILESVLVDGSELSFRFALVGSWLLGTDPDDRESIFDRFKSYYDLRSKIAHGDEFALLKLQDIVDLLRLDSARVLRHLLEHPDLDKSALRLATIRGETP